MGVESEGSGGDAERAGQPEKASEPSGPPEGSHCSSS